MNNEIRGPVTCSKDGCDFQQYGTYYYNSWVWLMQAHWWDQHDGKAPRGLDG